MGCFRGLLLLCFSVVSLSFGQTSPWPAIQLTPFASGFKAITTITNAGDGSGRLFVVEQSGTIRIVKNGATLPAPFLDISGRVSCCGERGLLGLAFPPGYAGKNYFYVYYTGTTFDITVSRFRVAGSPDTADPASETVILTIPHREFGNHNGGQIAFGRDGYLYIGTGDGGGGGDSLRNGQRPGSMLAKLLRIDVESGALPYAVPASNPLTNTAGFVRETWAWGLRNPWRFSFDRATGDLYIADVGQGAYEEINFQPASSPGGENYGWSIMEGLHCYNAAGCNTTGLTLPVAEYDHSGGNCSVTGGYVYRGAAFPAMQGVYLYGDYCSGRIWGWRRSPANSPSSELLKTPMLITTFGEDEAGELYVNNQATGEIFSISAAASVGIASVVSSASFEPGITPGSLASVFGTGLLSVSGVQAAERFPLPAVLGGTSVTVNNVPAPLYAVANANGTEQVNFQVPYELAGAQQATIVVTTNGAVRGQSVVPVLASQPAIFTTDGIHAAAFVTDGFVVVYGTGFGAVTNQPATGAAAPLDQLSLTTATPQATIGGQAATVAFSGLAPTFAGLYQLNVQIPAGVAAGEADLVVTLGDRSSKPVKVTLP